MNERENDDFLNTVELLRSTGEEFREREGSGVEEGISSGDERRKGGKRERRGRKTGD